MKKAALIGLAALVLSCASNPINKVEKTKLVVRASPRMGMANPYKPFHWRVYGRIVGPETEEYHCVKKTWIAGEGLGAIESVEESDCVPFEDRNKVEYNNAPHCMPYIKGGELFIPRLTVSACAPKEERGFERSFSNGYFASTAGKYNVCLKLSKGGKTITKKCASVVIVGGENEF